MRKNKKGYTLIEVLVSMSVLSAIILAWFTALMRVNTWKIKLIERAEIQKQAFFASERFFEMVKSWGTIDYEEYFNRKVIWTAVDSGHYSVESGYGNYWIWGSIWTNTYWTKYYCRSIPWKEIATANNGCFSDSDLSANLDWSQVVVWSNQQRYGQFALQYIDFNTNQNADNGDENWNWSITWDDDDLEIWKGPSAFVSWNNVHELYLINKNEKQRIVFRWNIVKDENAPASASCDGNIRPLERHCRGKLEFLKLDWKDWGEDHDKANITSDTFDWIIDTWVVSEEMTGNWNDIVAWDVGYNWYWEDFFSENISVSKFEVYPYPEYDNKLYWDSAHTHNSNVSPYVRIVMHIEPSFKQRRWIKGDPVVTKISTLINLND